MFDQEIVLDSLQKIRKAIDMISERSSVIDNPNDLLTSPSGMRDKIAHHYFEVDTDVVFRTIQEDIPQMKEVVERMISDLK